MANYLNYSVEHLLTDVLFRAWVLDDDAQAEIFWQHWLADYPEQAETVQEARALLLALAEKQHTVSNAQLDKIVEDTLGKLKSESETAIPVKRYLYPALARVAAALLLVAGLGWLVYNLPADGSFYTTAKKTSQAKAQTERRNDSDSPMTVLLGDKSTVTLWPGGRLRFSPVIENEPERVVYLDGEAFFDVVKDPAHPFFVHTNYLITKVLGTSFKVVAYERGRQASVSVVTGRVTVFTKKDLGRADRITTSPGSEVVVLSPNEQATFSQNRAGLAKSRVEELADLYHAPRFTFDETPVAEVLDTLEKAYGIDIEYEPEKVHGYLLTATFSEMSLHEELRLICRIMKTTYRIQDGRVIIETELP